jgi:hypothetical protein
MPAGQFDSVIKCKPPCLPRCRYWGLVSRVRRNSMQDIRDNIEHQLYKGNAGLKEIVRGLPRFVCRLVKKVLIADALSMAVDEVFRGGIRRTSRGVEFAANPARLFVGCLACNLLHMIRDKAFWGQSVKPSIDSLIRRLVNVGARVVCHTSRSAGTCMSRRLFLSLATISSFSPERHPTRGGGGTSSSTPGKGMRPKIAKTSLIDLSRQRIQP